MVGTCLVLNRWSICGFLCCFVYCLVTVMRFVEGAGLFVCVDALVCCVDMLVGNW